MTDKSKGPRGASAFILEKGTPGFTFGKKENKMGIRCSATRELVFQDCKVHKSQLLGKEGMGFIVAMKTLDLTRPGIGAQAVGIAQGAFDEALKYTTRTGPVRQADLVHPGDPAYTGRHVDPDRGGPRARLCLRQDDRCRRQGLHPVRLAMPSCSPPIPP